MLGLLNALPAASIGTMLQGLEASVKNWFGSGTQIIAYAICFIGIVGIILAINAVRKQQPSTKYWIVGVLALVFGGFLLGGFNKFTGVAKTQGQDSLDSALNGKG